MKATNTLCGICSTASSNDLHQGRRQMYNLWTTEAPSTLTTEKERKIRYMSEYRRACFRLPSRQPRIRFKGCDQDGTVLRSTMLGGRNSLRMICLQELSAEAERNIDYLLKTSWIEGINTTHPIEYTTGSHHLFIGIKSLPISAQLSRMTLLG